MFIGRIHPIKNLHSVLLALKDTSKGKIDFTIVGPLEHKDYFENCKSIISSLPPNVKVHWLGAVEPSNVPNFIVQTHFTICFSKSENFSYAIVESFLQSRPVIASFGTPWLDLEHFSAGFNLESDDVSGLTELLDSLIGLSNSDYAPYCSGSFEYIKKHYNLDFVRNSYLEMFGLNKN